MILSGFTWALIFFTILVQTANRILSKQALMTVKPLPLTLFTNGVGLAVLFPFVYKKFGILGTLDTRLTLLLIGAGVAWAIFGYVYNVALEKSPLSIFTILTQLQVILVAFFGFLFLDEAVSLYLWGGILLTCAASVLVSYKKESRKEIGSGVFLLCMSTALFGAIAIFLDSYNVHFFDLLLYAWVMMFISTIPLCFFYRPTLKDFHVQKVSAYLSVGLTFTLSYVLMITLFSQPDANVSYVYPFLRLGAIAAVIVGIFYFNERTNWKYKIVAILLACLGAVLIKLS